MTSPAVIIQILQIQTQSIKKNRLKTLLNSFFNKTKKVNSYNGLQIKFSDCAFKTKKRLKTVHYKNKNQTNFLKWHF